MKKYLIIQTAFIGDVILATSVVEKLNQFYPDSTIDVLVRKGNEGLLQEHPIVHELLVWEKNKSKYHHLKDLVGSVRERQYDVVVNLQRFASTGLITALSKAKEKIGFKENPFSFFFSRAFSHEIGNGTHEINRNQLLIEDLTDSISVNPKLYPSEKDYLFVEGYKKDKYVCISPSSVWYTKQLPEEKWVDLINNKINSEIVVYLIGSKTDNSKCERIVQLTKNSNVVNLAGELSLLQSAALMQTASMNYVNDSAPLHIASAMNAPVTAYFCSTIPDFGFGPLSDNSTIVQADIKLNCRPCGLHGKRKCPEKHFNCAVKIKV